MALDPCIFLCVEKTKIIKLMYLFFVLAVILLYKIFYTYKIFCVYIYIYMLLLSRFSRVRLCATP